MNNFKERPGCPIFEWISLYNHATNRMEKVGVMVGVQIDGPNGEKLFNADYAICNKNLDTFNPEKGLQIAYGRAIKARPKRASRRVVGENVHVGYTDLILDDVFGSFCLRCRKYYKDRLPTAKAQKMLELVDIIC